MASIKQLLALSAPVEIKAAEGDSARPTFTVVAYTGGPIEIAGWDQPVVVDLAGMQFGKSLVANLDHQAESRVGHVTSRSVEGGQLILSGVISAATKSADEVIDNARCGFPWQASIEARPTDVVSIKSGKSATVNGQAFAGPFYLVKSSVLKGFAFVSHGADDNTTVSIAASAAGNKKEISMRAEVKAWLKSMIPNVDVESLSEDEVANIEAQYDGLHPKKAIKGKLDDRFDAKKAEIDRVDQITEIALKACDARPYDVDAIKTLAAQAIDEKWTVEKFRLELLEATIPLGHAPFASRSRDGRLNNRVVEAAICMAGRLDGHEKMFQDSELQAAHDRFKNGIGLKQLFLLCAQANGYSASYAADVTIDVQRAAFGMLAPNRIQASGFSTLTIPTILSNTANKFLREGWMAIDQTPLRISAIRSVRDFKTITTVSLTGDLQYELVGNGGEIKHGKMSELSYTNKADTYARMLAITRQDIINDDLGALTSVPRRLGRGAMLLLNDIFWTEFLNNSAFFHSNYSNVNTGVADMTFGGLEATETIFLSLTDPDSKPLGIQPKIILVPTALRASAMTLMSSERIVDGTATAKQGDANIYRGRFVVESSPYMHNTSYTGYSAVAWYMLADPQEMPVIEIAALNGRVEPTVETADADFNVLGVQMRGYSDVGVNLQEVRGGVRADGGAS